MSPQDKHEQLDRVGFEFLIADLELGTTLARIAASSRNDPPKRARNVQNARRAYDVVQRLAARAMLSEEQRLEFNDKAAGLKSELEQLGEVF
jgi:hypothetical protein